MIAGLLSCLAAAAGKAPADTGAVAAPVEPDRDGRLTIFYATDRQPAGRPEPRRFFGRKWGETAFGLAVVKLPPRESLARLERAGRSLRSPGTPLKQVRLESLAAVPADSFFAAVAAAVERSAGRRALVFVHGYNMPLERAVRFTAQMERGLGAGVVAIAFSWPASPSYLADEEAVKWTEPDLEAFLVRLSDRIGARSIDLLGYSMGARALVGTLASIAPSGMPGLSPAPDPATPAPSGFSADPVPTGAAAGPPAARFGQLVLAAPDLESRIFARVLPRVARTARRVTLYSSSRDRALRASHKVHGHARAGEAGRDLLLLPEMDTIDVTAVRSDLTGHGYLEELMGDLELLLGRDAPPDERPGLTRLTRGDRTFWRMARK